MWRDSIVPFHTAIIRIRPQILIVETPEPLSGPVGERNDSMGMGMGMGVGAGAGAAWAWAWVWAWAWASFIQFLGCV